MSLACKKCGSDTTVQRTSEDKNTTIRIRKCKHCGKVQASLEIYVDDMKNGFEYLADKVQGEKTA
ncbi:hypothetical protein [Desulfovibrio sp. UCD-KL4C]|uniref:hypothetical protein n=1 Tax=Desulfovibrio sp. UCD-KL4C TaxID=2578120 RepID=UPI0025BC388A|nr:hypothetical protein [Desulfovibrio sp. UCD-KL4C]